jgi:hypothetical protein
MILLRGTIQNGQVVLPRPADLPDGTEVTVLTHDPAESLGIADEEWPTDTEGIARLLARMERVEPFDMTAEEEAEVEAWRRKVKEYTLANQDKAALGLFE